MLKTPTYFKLYAVKPLYHLKKKLTLGNQNDIMAKGQGKKKIILNLFILFFMKKYRKSISYLLKKCFKHKNVWWKDLFFFLKQFDNNMILVVLSSFINKAKGSWCLTSQWYPPLNPKVNHTTVLLVGKSTRLFWIKWKNNLQVLCLTVLLIKYAFNKVKRTHNNEPETTIC